MSHENLRVYLNDHLGGSAAALKLLQHLAAAEPAADGPLFTTLRADIEADQRVLKDLIERLGHRQSALAKWAGRFAGWAGRIKTRRLTGDARLGLLEACESLVLGITGKLALWRALAAARPQVPLLRDYDFAALERRAEDQRERVERRRLELAARVFGPPTR